SFYSSHLRDPVYDQLLSQVLKQFGIKRADVKSEIDNLSNFMKQLGTLRWRTRVDTYDVTSSYHLTTFREVANTYSSFDWKTFLQSLLGITGTKYEISNEEPIIVASPKYISGIVSLINKTNVR
ncbi:hypothetical protein Ahia01_001018800, partial [Argonauta hians]